jgi:3-methylfumaryl-CoA hydratase
MRERLDAWPVRGLTAALERGFGTSEGDEVPGLGQWLYFVPAVVRSRMGEDGHPQRGGFLPPVSLPRRMWAASDISFGRPMHIGEEVEKTARIASISVKEGKTGLLVFLKIENIYRVGGEQALSEVQTLVYRDDPKPDEAPPPPKLAPETAAWSEAVETDTALLFRYSAVTFNAHRIHYDAPYARAVEGYPNVVVHGQLTATMLFDALRRNVPARRPRTFGFRAMKPIFVGEKIFLEGAPSDSGYELWARGANGHLCLSASVQF